MRIRQNFGTKIGGNVGGNVGRNNRSGPSRTFWLVIVVAIVVAGLAWGTNGFRFSGVGIEAESIQDKSGESGITTR